MTIQSTSTKLSMIVETCYGTTFLTSTVTHDIMNYDSKRHLKLDFEQLIPFRKSTSNIVISRRITMENNVLCIM